MGDNGFAQSGNENFFQLKSIYKLDYFEKKKLKIKKIFCNYYYFNIFLTGYNYILIYFFIFNSIL
jgi:hypothetical protein